MKNHRLANAIKIVAWADFFRQLEYKSEIYGSEVIKVDSLYPSSQICSKCGFKNVKVKSLSVRTWICPECGSHHNRDVNAAINILKKALEQRNVA
jgi:putative transposase